MLIAIHQPNFLPWLGYFYKLARVDAFVFLDSVPYSKNSFSNRNRIKTQAGMQWLTVPVCTSGKHGQSIEKLMTNPDENWKRKHLNALITSYGRAEHFNEVFGILRAQYGSVEDRTYLADFNITLIRVICDYLGIAPHFYRSSELCVLGQSTELLVNICQRLGAKYYLAGAGALKYQEDVRFEDAGVHVTFSDFISCPYSQLWGSFVPALSVVDALMNCGKDTRRILDSSTGDLTKLSAAL
jgi:hypothetical protein